MFCYNSAPYFFGFVKQKIKINDLTLAVNCLPLFGYFLALNVDYGLRYLSSVFFLAVKWFINSSRSQGNYFYFLVAIFKAQYTQKDHQAIRPSGQKLEYGFKKKSRSFLTFYTQLYTPPNISTHSKKILDFSGKAIYQKNTPLYAQRSKNSTRHAQTLTPKKSYSLYHIF